MNLIWQNIDKIINYNQSSHKSHYHCKHQMMTSAYIQLVTGSIIGQIINVSALI